ncbi:MAG: hypothetical protein RL885_16715 [Planctomycetota bacterium]
MGDVGQLLLVALIVGVAAGYLGARTAATWRKGTGCGGSGKCHESPNRSCGSSSEPDQRTSSSELRSPLARNRR